MPSNVRIIESSRSRSVESLLARRSRERGALVRRVAQIVEGVRRGGDTALMRVARRFERVALPIEVTADEMHDAADHVPDDVRQAIDVAAANSRRIARRPLPRPWTSQPAAV